MDQWQAIMLQDVALSKPSEAEEGRGAKGLGWRRGMITGGQKKYLGDIEQTIIYMWISIHMWIGIIIYMDNLNRT